MCAAVGAAGVLVAGVATAASADSVSDSRASVVSAAPHPTAGGTHHDLAAPSVAAKEARRAQADARARVLRQAAAVRAAKAAAQQRAKAEAQHKAALAAARAKAAQQEQARLAAARARAAATALARNTFSGLASWYGAEFAGRRTASGAVYNPSAYTAASRTLPLGTRLQVCRAGACVVVVVNDRGPYVGGRVLDLSQAAASRLGLIGVGVGWVTATRVA